MKFSSYYEVSPKILIGFSSLFSSIFTIKDFLPDIEYITVFKSVEKQKSIGFPLYSPYILAPLISAINSKEGSIL